MERLNGWSLGKRLGIGFGLVVAVFLLALGLTLVYSASAQNAWKQTERWQAATRGATDQVRGTEVQMMAQANLVATMDPSTGPAVVSSGSAGVRGQRGETASAAQIVASAERLKQTAGELEMVISQFRISAA